MRIGVIGSRTLPEEDQGKVCQVIEYLLDRGHYILHGGALGCDHFVLQALLSDHSSDRGILFSAWRDIDSFPLAVQPDVREYLDQGGQIVWGDSDRHQPYSVTCASLLGRNQRLVDSCDGLIAFIYGKSRGTLSTVRYALRYGLPVIIFVINPEDIDLLPKLKGVVWYSVKQRPNRNSSIWEDSFQAMYSSLTFRIKEKPKLLQKVEVCHG